MLSYKVTAIDSTSIIFQLVIVLTKKKIVILVERLEVMTNITNGNTTREIITNTVTE